MTHFPDLTGLGPTRDTLHRYALAIEIFPRAHAEPHPKWWHIGLRGQPNGFRTAPMPLPGGGECYFVLNLHTHRIELYAQRAVVASWDITTGQTSAALGQSLIDAAAALGLRADYPRARYESHAPRAYDKTHAARWFAAVRRAQQVFETHRASLTGETSPVHLWPHHFDLATEVFGKRVVEIEEHGQVQSFPAQLNLGFSTGDAGHPEPYFYSNPFPFDPALAQKPLPHGAFWHTASWQGSLLPYTAVAELPDGEKRLAAYANAVYKAARAGLEL